MVDFKCAIVATPSIEEYDRLESFVTNVFHRENMMRNDVWHFHKEQTCIRISHLQNDRMGFGYCPRDYYEFRDGVRFTERAPEILRICSVDTFIDYVSGCLQRPRIDNEILASLL